MRRFSWVCSFLSVLLVGACQVHAAPVLIDFATPPGVEGSTVGQVGIANFGTAIYVAPGLPVFGFQGDAGISPDSIASSVFANGSISDALGGPGKNDFGLGGPFTITFAIPVNNLSFSVGDLEASVALGTEKLTLVATVQGGAMLAPQVVNGTTDLSVIGVSVTGSNIISLQITPTPNNNGRIGYGLDNFQFEPVPEPTSLALFGMVLAGAGGYGIRRRRKLAV